ncbi:MAG: protein kinase domain-containing protein [Polyangiales bacterium]
MGAREGYETTQLASTPAPGSSAGERWSGNDLDHFHVERLLGRGGMGAVYLAHDGSLDRKVAIKVLPDQVVGNPALEERFLLEARAQAKLASPNVVAIHFIGRLPGSSPEKSGLYFAMEWVEGQPLEALLERNALLPPEEARQAMIHVARGLRDAHRAGIIHRDVKPSNLLRDRDGWVKIADFGIAKVRPTGEAATTPSLTRDGDVLGTPLYMAPEQAAGEAIDHRADMYALGCTFYHLLAGKPPFEGGSSVAIAAKHIHERPIPIGKRVKDVPPKLAAIIDRLMEKKPASRYETYEDLLADLEAAAPATIAYAGVWARGAANAVDCLIAGMLVAALGWIGLAIHLAHVVIGQWLWGRTVGKWMMSIHVERTDGSKLSLGRSFARTIAALWLPFLIGGLTLATKGTSHLLNIVEHLQPKESAEMKSILLAIAISHGLLTVLWLSGLLLAAFHPERRALHDLLAGTRVTYALRHVARTSTA